MKPSLYLRFSGLAISIGIHLLCINSADSSQLKRCRAKPLLQKAFTPINRRQEVLENIESQPVAVPISKSEHGNACVPDKVIFF